MNNSGYVSSRKIPFQTRIHKNNFSTDLHLNIFIQQLTANFSISLAHNRNEYNFFDVESENPKLYNLLLFHNDYCFTNVLGGKLSSILYNLIFSNKTYLEFVKITDDKNQLVGLDLSPFDAVKLFSTFRYSWFITKNCKDKFCIYKLDKKYYVPFTIKEIGLKNNYFKKLLGKFAKTDISIPAKFFSDTKMENIFDFNAWRNWTDFYILKYSKKIGWTRPNYQNRYLSESYFLYKTIIFKKFQINCMQVFLNNINLGLKKLENEFQVQGRIITTEKYPDFSKEWEKYIAGEINTTELLNIIFPQ